MTAYLPYIGGAQVHIHSIARQFAANGHPARVLSFWDRNRGDWLLGTTLRAPLNPEPYTIDGVAVDRIPIGMLSRGLMAPWVLGYYALKPVAIMPLAQALYPKVKAAAAGGDIVHNVRIGREPLTLASLWAARKHDVPFCMTTLHHPKWMTAYDIPYHLLYRQADQVMALTRAEKEMLIRLGVREDRIVVIGHGPEVAQQADGSAFRAKHRLTGPIVLFLAEKRAYKGFQQLTAAAPRVWERHPDTQFVFIGPGTKASRAFFAEVSDPRIIELDVVSLQEKTDALAACDVLCVPSSQESFGGVYTEAWTQAKPVVGCDIAAVRDVIDDMENGLLVRQDAADIAEKLCYLLDKPEQARRLGRAGYDKVEREFSWHTIYHRTMVAYQRLLGGT